MFRKRQCCVLSHLICGEIGICYKITVGKAVDKETEQIMAVPVNINIQKQPCVSVYI